MTAGAVLERAPDRTPEERAAILAEYARAGSVPERAAVAARHGVSVDTLQMWRSRARAEIGPSIRHIRDPYGSEWGDTPERAALVRRLISAAGHGLEEWPEADGEVLVACKRARVAGGRLYIACVRPGVVVRGRDSWRSEARSDDGRSRRVRGLL